MKCLYLLAAAVWLAFPCPVLADGVRMLVIDPDAATNVRDAPAGNVIAVIPNPDAQADEAALERRAVVVTGQRGNWFSVLYDGDKSGWMHGSVLGSCATGTEDGEARLHAAPVDGPADLARVPNGTRLNVAGVSGSWAKVRFMDGAGRPQEGWLPGQCLFSNPYNSCWAKAAPVAVEPAPSAASFTNSIGMSFVRIPAGSFLMGAGTASGRAHRVTLSRPFYLGRCEVTQAEWQSVMGGNPSKPATGKSLPVTQVSWEDARRFIAALNAREGHGRYRLPTEAEWEFAARGPGRRQQLALVFQYAGNHKKCVPVAFRLV